MNRLYLIAGLALALCISLGINFAQYRADLIEDTKAPLQAQIDAATRRQEVTDAVAAARVADDKALRALEAQLASKQVEVRIEYRTRVSTLPAPSCAPGHERVEAWNMLAKPEEPR